MKIHLLEPPALACEGKTRRFLLADHPLDLPNRTILGTHELQRMRVGDILGQDGSPVLQAVSRIWHPNTDDRGVAAWIMQCIGQILPEDGDDLEWLPRGRTLAWITLSDKGARGEREDTSGPLLETQMREAMDLSLCRGFLIPDSSTRLKALLTDLALFQGFDCILTTGGTGIGPRDITPETTLAVIDKRLPGFEQAMAAASLAKTPMGVISRAVVGTLGSALIINLPGSPKAVRENLAAVLPAIGHSLDKLQGDPSDCATLPGT
ncbi:MogA/MoaB family molybdenum cofactor biosynthesis protein [Desulfoplanes sp.]